MSCCRVGILNALDNLTIESRRTRQTCGPNCHSLGQVLRLRRFKKIVTLLEEPSANQWEVLLHKEKSQTSMFCTANLPLAVQTREFCFLARKTCLARTPSATKPFVAMVLVATISCHTCAGYMDWSSSPWQPRMELQLADVLNKMPWTASVFITRIRMQQVQKLSQDLRIHMWRRCKFISDVIGTGSSYHQPKQQHYEGKIPQKYPRFALSDLRQYGILMTCVGIQNKHVSPQLWPLIPWLCCLIL